jgi:signal transduction histidine kinase
MYAGAQWPMRLSEFITSHQQPILVDWVAFARQQLPAARNMDEAALLDHGRQILDKIVSDMQRPQAEQERQDKSEGNSASASTADNVPSRTHARQRERQGFEIEQLVAEYRALRATVLRLWSAASDAKQHQDLEDVIRFNEAVDQAIAESLEVFVAQGEKTRDLFIGMLGHDLRGPLTTIAACATLVRRRCPSEDRQALLILRSVAQMKALLDDLIEYTRDRLGSGLPIEPAPLKLDGFTRDILDEIAVIGTGRALQLTCRGDMDGQWDARRMHQALSNLVFNALKYGALGAPVHVDVDGSQPDDIQITVRNSGAPIAPELLPRLFDPLVRADGHDAAGDVQVAGANLGLGLYVVREIAHAHGGSVDVSSDAAATCFELRLPRVCVRRDASGTAP